MLDYDVLLESLNNQLKHLDSIIIKCGKTIEKANNQIDDVKSRPELSDDEKNKIIEDNNKIIDEAKNRQILAIDKKRSIVTTIDDIETAKKIGLNVSDFCDKQNEKETDTTSQSIASESFVSDDEEDKQNDNYGYHGLVLYEGNKDEPVEKKESGTGKKVVTTIGVIVLLGALAAGGYALIKEARSGKIKELPPEPAPTPVSDTLLEEPKEETNVETDNIETSILFGDQEDYEPLTTERMEDLVSEYANKYSEEYEGVIETKDIVKFAAIANIDVLSEDNKELANQLFGNQPKEEYLNDAAKLIGATVMYNYKQWAGSLSTKDFIRVSDLIYGDQRDKMLVVEDYTDRIASAANMNDEELVNKIVSEFIDDLNSGSLSKLDDGVGFAAQVNIALVADVIARDYLNQENFDMFQILKTSEKYVSNIFRVYEECTSVQEESKTLTKTN